MSIPCKMRPVGLESLPLGYTRLEFLQATGGQYIYTGLPAKNITVRIKHRPFAGEGGNGRPVLYSQKYETVDGKGYFNNILVSANSNQNGLGYGVSTQYLGRLVTVQFFDLPFGLLTEGEVNLKDLFVKCTVEGKGSKSAAIPSNFRDKDFGYMGLCYFNNPYIGYVYSFSANYDGIPAANYIPALDSTGTPCMFDTVSKQPFYNAETTGIDFIAGMTMVQALKLKNLPARTATLNVSLPEGYESQEEVMESIRQAEEKGWTLNITTHTPT